MVAGQPWQVPGEMEAAPTRRSVWGARVAMLMDAELAWVSIFGSVTYAVTYLSYLGRVGGSLAWLALAAAALPLGWRLARNGLHELRTPFDPAVGILLVGALAGLWASPDRAMSLRAFQTLLVCVVGYYSLATCRRPAGVIKATLSVGVVAVLAALVVAFNNTSLNLLDYRVPASWRQLVYKLPWLSHSSSGNRLDFELNYGLGLATLVAFAFGLAYALFGLRARLRIVAAAATILWGAANVAVNYWGASRLLTAQSIVTRLPLWRLTIEMLQGSPLLGVGLGAWPIAAAGAVGQFVPSHPHSSYLLLYSDMGLLGIVSLLVAMVAGIRLGWRVLRFPRSHGWYAFGVGVVLALAAAALFGLVEKATIGFFDFGMEGYYYGYSPAPALLAGALVVAHRLLVGHGGTALSADQTP